ncbi:MAG: hypothetical protein JOZ69_11600 [Myxococcales bacterium]|nr:hypothetical protein [Myxococcales bacterium]
MGIGNGPSVTETTHGAGGGEASEHWAQAFVAHVHSGAELGPSEGTLGAGAGLDNELVEAGKSWAARHGLLVGWNVGFDFEMGVVVVAGEREGDGSVAAALRCSAPSTHPWHQVRAVTLY